MSDPDRPEYKVYRSRRRPLGDLLRPSGDLESLRERRRQRREREPREPGAPPQITPKRVLKWLAIAAGAWIALSVVLFFASAQLEQGVSDEAENALTSGGNLLTGSTILVLGSDERSEETAEPGSGGPGRADSIMLLHASFGRVRKLSILRDSEAAIPGHGIQKINAAYALGGAALTIETVEAFMGNGLEINHLIEVNFADFPELIDALGGIDVVADQRICSSFGNFYRGIRFKKGKNHLNGDRALGFARVRTNTCAVRPEDDRDRAARQQKVLDGIRDQALSPSTFFRLPWVSWQAPKTVRTDMAGPNLMALFTDLATGSSEETEVLDFSGPGTFPGSVHVSDGDKKEAVDELLGR